MKKDNFIVGGPPSLPPSSCCLCFSKMKVNDAKNGKAKVPWERGEAEFLRGITSLNYVSQKTLQNVVLESIVFTTKINLLQPKIYRKNWNFLEGGVCTFWLIGVHAGTSESERKTEKFGGILSGIMRKRWEFGKNVPKKFPNILVSRQDCKVFFETKTFPIKTVQTLTS